MDNGARGGPGGIRRNVPFFLKKIESIYQIRDLDTLLETVLFEARRFVTAEAGTLYLRKGNDLYFRYVQNDALFTGVRARDRYIYRDQRLQVDRSSLAGYVADTGESLLIDDVYDIPPGVSYAFNPAFDVKSSYKTTSVLVVPLSTTTRDIVGILQLINARNGGGKVVPFSMQDNLFITEFARNAANAIEKAKLSREMVLRMVEMAELRDPYETSQHAKRVGEFSVQLFEKWALRHGVSDSRLKSYRDALRHAAMLHDVGKVALSDLILQKPGLLEGDERQVMRLHTLHGYRLFKNSDSIWDRMAAEVALNHHEHWDGRGYPGRLRNLHARNLEFGPGKQGKEIPLSARIVALADVFDALVSKRAYKEAWKEDTALTYLRQQAGQQFDPELVQLFLRIRDVIRAIRRHYNQNGRREDHTDVER